VREKIDIRSIWKIDPREAIIIIQQGFSLLDKWKLEFDRTKTAIEGEGTVPRWEFGRTREIYARPGYMKKIL
jgi:hypothetical protein